MNEMKRRWFQFSLRTAIVMMVIAAVGIGVYIQWWPIYRAGKALDNSEGNKTFAAWPLVRRALAGDAGFQKMTETKCVMYVENLRIETERIERIIVGVAPEADRSLGSIWYVEVESSNGERKVRSVGRSGSD